MNSVIAVHVADVMRYALLAFCAAGYAMTFRIVYIHGLRKANWHVRLVVSGYLLILLGTAYGGWKALDAGAGVSFALAAILPGVILTVAALANLLVSHYEKTHKEDG